MAKRQRESNSLQDVIELQKKIHNQKMNFLKANGWKHVATTGVQGTFFAKENADGVMIVCDLSTAFDFQKENPELLFLGV
jgi:hypothetical protein